MNHPQVAKTLNSLDFSLSEIAREARKRARLAQLRGSRHSQQEILKRLDAFEKKRREIEERLMVVSLSTEQVNSLVANLSRETAQARRLLQRMRKHEDVLQHLKKGSDVATAILKTVTDIVA